MAETLKRETCFPRNLRASPPIYNRGEAAPPFLISNFSFKPIPEPYFLRGHLMRDTSLVFPVAPDRPHPSGAETPRHGLRQMEWLRRQDRSRRDHARVRRPRALRRVWPHGQTGTTYDGGGISISTSHPIPPGRTPGSSTSRRTGAGHRTFRTKWSRDGFIRRIFPTKTCGWPTASGCR